MSSTWAAVFRATIEIIIATFALYREREELFVNTLQRIGQEPLKERVYPKVLEVSKSCAGYQGTEVTKLKCQIAAHRLPDCRIDLHQTKKCLIYLLHRLT